MMIVYPVIGSPIYSYRVSVQKVLQIFIELCVNSRNPELYKIPNDKIKFNTL